MERIVWVDAAKGLAAILVVLGHFLFEEKAVDFIFSFHMPLFFFLSGVTLNVEKYKQGGAFVKKLLRGIVVPYFIFAFVFWLTKVLGVFAVKHDYMLLLKRFVGIFFCMSGKSDYYCGYWFLICLFVAEIFAYFLFKNYGAGSRTLVFSFMIALASSSIFSFCNISVPFFLLTALVAQFFVVLGRQFGYVFLTVQKWKYLWLLGYLIVILGINGNRYLFGQKFDMASNFYGNPVMFFSVAIVGICATISLAFCLEKNDVLQKIGRYSLYLYGVQMPVMAVNNMFMKRFGMPENYVLEVSWYFCLFLVFLFLWEIRGYYDYILNVVLRRVAI